jgi:anti-sigma factor (TIGR02949 family)
LLTCKDFLNELGEYLDEALEPDVRAKLHQHVAECPNCWVILDTTEKTIKVYRGMEPEPIPNHIHSRLMQAIERKTQVEGRGARVSH